MHVLRCEPGLRVAWPGMFSLVIPVGNSERRIQYLLEIIQVLISWLC